MNKLLILLGSIQLLGRTFGVILASFVVCVDFKIVGDSTIAGSALIDIFVDVFIDHLCRHKLFRRVYLNHKVFSLLILPIKFELAYRLDDFFLICRETLTTSLLLFLHPLSNNLFQLDDQVTPWIFCLEHFLQPDQALIEIIQLKWMMPLNRLQEI